MTDSRKVIPFYYSPSGDTEEDKLLEPFEYVIRYTEKHRCTKLTLVFNYWLKISPDKLRHIDEIISIVYNVCILNRITKFMQVYGLIISMLQEQRLEFIRGQGMDMYWKDNLMCPTDEDYEKNAIRKSFGSFKYTKDTLQELNKKIRIEIECLGGNPLLVKMLKDYGDEVPCYVTGSKA
ncbi:terpene synthase-like [Temnothorax americanus]|uniref:terpene synthase-like n=1 Tax=Temnothorax americanus TaxID=1964332 RepID=UPI004068030F